MISKRALTALIIWWCEGTKPRKDKRWKNSYLCPIEVINTDPKLVKIFADFLRDDMQVNNERLKGQIQIHEGDDKEMIEDFWANAVGIPKTQFNKTIIRAVGNKPGKNKGTFKLRLYDKVLYLKLNEMINAELNELNTGDWLSW